MSDINTQLGAAIRDARQQRRLSIRGAADAAGMSEGRWRQIELGYQQVASGVRVPARPKESTVRAMARAVQLDVDEALALAGFEADAPADLDPPDVLAVDLAPESIGPRLLALAADLSLADQRSLVRTAQVLRQLAMQEDGGGDISD